MESLAFKNAYQIAAEEKKALGPSPEQHALADLLEFIGTWPLFLTTTFRPNDFEEIAQSKEGVFHQNEKLSFSNTVIRGKRRGYQGRWESGGIRRGVPGISPGWSPEAAEKCVLRLLREDKELRKTRWFMVIEGSKYRNCAHGHVLMANAGHVNWERVDREWQRKRGRFQVEFAETSKGMANYLAKQYVGKSYGNNEKCRFQFSKNCRDPKPDPLPGGWYFARMFEWKCHNKGSGSKKVLAGLGRARKRFVSGALQAVGA